MVLRFIRAKTIFLVSYFFYFASSKPWMVSVCCFFFQLLPIIRLNNIFTNLTTRRWTATITACVKSMQISLNGNGDDWIWINSMTNSFYIELYYKMSLVSETRMNSPNFDRFKCAKPDVHRWNKSTTERTKSIEWKKRCTPFDRIDR